MCGSLYSFRFWPPSRATNRWPACCHIIVIYPTSYSPIIVYSTRSSREIGPDA